MLDDPLLFSLYHCASGCCCTLYEGSSLPNILINDITHNMPVCKRIKSVKLLNVVINKVSHVCINAEGHRDCHGNMIHDYGGLNSSLSSQAVQIADAL